MSNKLTDFYKEILSSCSLNVIDDIVHQTLPDEGDVPVTISKRTVVIPTRRWLSDENWKDLQGFHPMCENVLRKESQVFRFIRRAIIIQCSKVILDTAAEYIKVCVNTKGHSVLNPITQAPLLSCAPEADEKFAENFKHLLDKINPLGETPVISIVSLRGKQLKGKDYTRISRITFPLLEALEESKNSTVYGAKMRKKDIEYLRNIFTFILSPETGVVEEDQFSAGTRSPVAPSLHAMLKSFAELLKVFNVALRRFDLPQIPFTWEDDLEDFTEFKGLIPVLEGNDGEYAEGEERSEPKVETVAPVATRTTTARVDVAERTERRTEAPQSASTEGRGSMADLHLSSRRSMPSWAEEEDRARNPRARNRYNGYSDRESSRYERNPNVRSRYTPQRRRW